MHGEALGKVGLMGNSLIDGRFNDETVSRIRPTENPHSLAQIFRDRAGQQPDRVIRTVLVDGSPMETNHAQEQPGEENQS